MYSNRYVAIHCCQEKYFNEIKLNGIVRESKAAFICDLEKLSCSELYNTLAVLIYHGVGLDGWRKLLKENKNLEEIDKNLVIVICNLSNEQENIIKDRKILNYYKIIDKNERTFNYCKIKDIGKIRNVIFTKKIPLYKMKIENIENISLAKDRFFIKNIYRKPKVQGNETVNEIKKICYKIANENLSKIEKKLMNYKFLMKGCSNE